MPLDGEELNEAFVRAGWALAWNLATGAVLAPHYDEAEAEGTDAGLGIWRAIFVLPWKLRQRQQARAEHMLISFKNVLAGSALWISAIAPATTEAEIYAERPALDVIRNSGLAVLVDDQVSDSCWLNPRSSENKAVSLLNQYRLYNPESQLTLFVNANGYRVGSGICAARYAIQIYSIAPFFGHIIYGEVTGIITGPEISDLVRSAVEDFIEELVATLVNEGI